MIPTTTSNCVGSVDVRTRGSMLRLLVCGAGIYACSIIVIDLLAR